MKILLLNVHSSMNVGDEALLQSALAQLKLNFTESEFTLSLNESSSYTGGEKTLPSISSWVHPIDERGTVRWRYGRLLGLLPATLIPVLSWRWLKRAIYWLTPPALRLILSGYLDADLVIGTPGGYLYSSGRGINFLVVMYAILLGVLAGKPVYLLPQSIGPIKRRWEGWLLGRLLDRVRMVMVREQLSYQLVQQCKVRKPHVYLLPDMAFILPEAAQEEADVWLAAQGIAPLEKRPRLGITLVNWVAQNKNFTRQEVYEQACAAAARWFIERQHGRVILFPQVWGPTEDQDDRIPAKRLVEQLPELAESIHLISNPLPPALIKTVYGKMDLFIGTRMHSNIFALSEGVPVIAIGYQYKTRGIAEMAGMGDWVIEIQDVDEKLLVTRLETLWEKRLKIREQLHRTIPGIIEQARRAGSLVQQDYNRIRLSSR